MSWRQGQRIAGGADIICSSCMKLIERLRRRKNGILHRPKTYAAHYAFVIPYRMGQFAVIAAWSLFESLLSLRLPQLSVPYMMRVLHNIGSIGFGLFGSLKTTLSRMLDIGGWLHEIRQNPSASAVYRYLNARLCDLLRQKWERLRRLWRELRSPGKMTACILHFLHEHTRNIRLIRRGMMSTIMGLALAKALTVLYFSIAGTAALLSFFGLNCMILLLAAINFIATKIACPLARIIDRRISRMDFAHVFSLLKSGRLTTVRRKPQVK